VAKRKRKTRRLKFRSGSEKKCSDLLNKRKVEYAYEPTKFTYVLTKTYLPDFYISKYNFYIEVKGRFTSSDRAKHLYVKQQHPDLDVRFMFDNPNAKLYKGSPSTNADWAIKHNYLYCKTSEGIPKEWFKNAYKKHQ
tara:strand:+ start:2497 stop:2907 length:411 start_codon:yes stop_codon:yes gene_type:complete